MQPDEDAHPRLRELWQDSASATTVWRLRYNMPPTDPRVLTATETDIVEDLLTLGYHDLRLHIARNPAAAVTSSREAQKDYAEAAEHAKRSGSYARDIAALKKLEAKSRGEVPKPVEKKKTRSWFGRKNG